MSSTVLSELTSVLLTRKSFHTLTSLFADFPERCVGVWQNDRVEIIANDRQSFLPFLPQKNDSLFT